MAEVKEDTQGKIRDLPISAKLRALLLATAEATGVNRVRVTSGGQCKKGTCTKRTGSTRHDDGNAADLQLLVAGRTLKFTNNIDLKTFERFVTEAARTGATGLGAGIDYMGDATIHVGFGPKAVWGAGGVSAKAPEWIRRAALAGWSAADPEFAGSSEKLGDTEALPELDSADEEVEEDYE